MYEPYGQMQALNQLYQQQLQQPQTQMQQTPQVPLDTFGGSVSSIDEVRAARVDPSGVLTFFYSKGENRVYGKYIDMSGLPVIVTFNREDTPQESLDKRVAHLEELVKSLVDSKASG